MSEEVGTPETRNAPETPSARRSVGEAERARVISEVTKAVVSNLSLHDLLLAVSACLRQYFNHDFASVVLYDEEKGELRVHALDSPTPDGVLGEGSLLSVEGAQPGLAPDRKSKR